MQRERRIRLRRHALLGREEGGDEWQGRKARVRRTSQSFFNHARGEIVRRKFEWALAHSLHAGCKACNNGRGLLRLAIIYNVADKEIAVAAAR